MEFRNGMELIGMGHDPLDGDGAELRGSLRWHDPPEALVSRTLPLGCQVVTANVREYFIRHGGTDWLGFMGLALWRIENMRNAVVTKVANELHTENCELLLKLISNSWSSRFYTLLTDNPDVNGGPADRAVADAVDCCKRIIRGQRRRFGIADLELMERAILRLLEHRRIQSSTP
jgi:hypothetical protein